MKTISSTIKTITGSSLLVAAALFAGSVLAQDRGAAQLVNRSASSSSPAPATAPMACSKCKDTTVQVAQPGKGAWVQTSTVQRHGCPTCSDKLAIKGTGKQAQETVMHGCKEASGCAAK